MPSFFVVVFVYIVSLAAVIFILTLSSPYLIVIEGRAMAKIVPSVSSTEEIGDVLKT